MAFFPNAVSPLSLRIICSLGRWTLARIFAQALFALEEVSYPGNGSPVIVAEQTGFTCSASETPVTESEIDHHRATLRVREDQMRSTVIVIDMLYFESCLALLLVKS